ncbi:type IV secretion system DNA-binding domain-containing protein [Candidatus Kaiserbacteria bacterium]|nr:type IV secretion system DNA-binding domain-containing protein [Candidatus Kaiserbacteria bacterium]
MNEYAPQKFASPEEEITFLRNQIASKERELLERSPEADRTDLESIAKHELLEYGTFTPNSVLDKAHQLPDKEVTESVIKVETTLEPIEEIIQIAKEKGIHNALTVLEKTKNAFTTDEVHRRLIELIKSDVAIQNLKEGVPPWQILHMTLFEVSLPEISEHHGQAYQLSEIISMMEQFFSGMQNVGQYEKNLHYVIEIAVADKSDEIVFYVAVPTNYVDLFQKQILSLYPHAELTEQVHDYNIFVEGGESIVARAELKKHHVYPIAQKESFESDPLSVILNAFSKIEREGGGAALQFVIKRAPQKYTSVYEGIIKRVRDGVKPSEAIARSSLRGEIFSSFKEIAFSGTKKKDYSALPTHDHVDQDALELFNEKLKFPVADVNIRIAVSSRSEARSKQILSEVESAFNQFERTQGNRFVFKTLKGSALTQAIKAFSFREFVASTTLPLTFRELATVIHFPGAGINTSPQFKQSRAKTAAAPVDMPSSGTLLGINSHRSIQKEIYITEEDRMRHFYVIGQTGTGKTTLMKNMLVQDIQAGHGVCFIDPHGTDIEDVLSAVPREREQDIIYFDPSRTDQVVGLNMLEYDINKPEQKTFVVNELFSIFQKLYGANPESMGPMFEQYFRNATLLVMEDPESGNTLMDISRVMADAKYRRMKLEKATNPVVTQFWREIATKAGGEASLENIVPYIVSKFDVFTANDYMRPIIGQQKSAFNFRHIMDEKKILLVNLSKGRLGEINANLIGMIIVGKILMAALSRVDDPTKGFPPFFLHMDEFQNVSTDSISAILSEARKYKLGLTIAHQFIAQLDEKIKDAVFGNVGSMVAFRVGPEDSQFLEQQFSPTFTANDLMNIPNRNAYVRALANGSPTKPFSMSTIAPMETDLNRVQSLILASNQRNGRPREEVEAEISARYQKPTLPESNPFAKI